MIETRTIAAAAWQEALPVLLRGDVVGIPTDTVYGIAAVPLDEAAIDRIYAAKDRPSEKALPMLVSALADAERIAHLSRDVRRLCDAFWPGALTIVAAAAPGFRSPALADDGTVALRMPAHDLALRLIAVAGGVLAVTSANRSGQPPATTPAGVLEQLGGRIAAVIDAGPSPGGTASTVVRVDRQGLTVLREGAITDADIERIIGPGPLLC